MRLGSFLLSFTGSIISDFFLDWKSAVLNSLVVRGNNQNIYESIFVTGSYNVFYSQGIHNCADIYYSKNLTGCKYCIGCSNLENQSYCIYNKQYTEEKYNELRDMILRDEIDDIVENMKKVSLDSLDLISSEIENGFLVSHVPEGRNLIIGGGDRNYNKLYDCFNVGSYQNIFGAYNVGGDSEHIYNSCLVSKCMHIYHSYFVESCSYCFGCVGLRNKSYCILNKQYTKEAWYEKVEEIFTIMEKEGALGRFFSGRMNPFYFNDTAASLIEDFDKKDIIADGYLWRDEEVKVDIPEWMDVVEVADLGHYESIIDTGWTIDPSILKKVIKDEEGNIYRIIKMEYDFLMKYGLPLPRKHWLERLKGHFRVK